MFAGLNCMLSQPYQPHDDLESLLYVLLHLAMGELPWEGASSKLEIIEAKHSLRGLAGLAEPAATLTEHLVAMRRKATPRSAPVYAAMRRLLEVVVDEHERST